MCGMAKLSEIPDAKTRAVSAGGQTGILHSTYQGFPERNAAAIVASWPVSADQFSNAATSVRRESNVSEGTCHDAPGRARTSIADAMRAVIAPTLNDWEQRVRQQLPRVAAKLNSDELRANLSDFLADLADTLEPGANGVQLAKLRDEDGPARGIRRLRQGFSVGDLLLAEWHLWQALDEQLRRRVGRELASDERQRLREAFDAAMNVSVVCYCDVHAAQLRAAADAELKRLTFVSHDLHNTLNATRLWLTSLQHKLGRREGFDDELDVVAHTEQSIEETIHSMRQLLEYERLRKVGVRPQLQRVALAELAAHVAAEFETPAESKGLTLDVDVAPAAEVRTDLVLLTTILRNLIGNAVKYCQRGRVRVTAQAPPDGDGRGPAGWTLSVSDDGPGIAPESLRHIFEAFCRGSSDECSSSSGVGLGLAIAQEVASALSIRLSVDSQPGAGSTFRVHFPHPASATATAAVAGMELVCASDRKAIERAHDACAAAAAPAAAPQPTRRP
jgi:signal transduction histidine kinase